MGFRKEKQQPHPEQRTSEVFLGNVRNPDLDAPVIASLRDGFHSIGWSTKRLGKTAYDADTQAIPGLRPVFVQRKELAEANINPDRPWK